MINAIIMASGLSTRMGENKLLLEFKGKKLIEHTFECIKNVKFNEVIVVTQYEEIIDIAKKYNFTTVKNNNYQIGQSESIKLGILNSKQCDGYMFFVGDQPFIDEKSVNKLLNSFKEDKECIIIPKDDYKTGNPVIFPYSKKNDLLTLKNDEKGKKVINSSNKIKYIKVDKRVLKDIDTKEDYYRIRGE